MTERVRLPERPDLRASACDPPDTSRSALTLHESPAAGHSLYQAILHQDVDGAAHSANRQAGLRRHIRDRGQLRSDLAALDPLPQLSGDLLVGMRG